MYADAFRFVKKEYSDAFQKWRWKKGISLRQSVPHAKKNSSIIQEYLSLPEWTGDVQSAISNSRDNIKIIPPKESTSTQTFRAAGGKRLPWPGNSAAFNDIQDHHAWHRLYWLLDCDNVHAVKYLKNWFASEPNAIMLHPYTVSERICNLCQFVATNVLNEPLQIKIINQVYKDAIWLFNHLEYRLGIHNHLLNNARALSTAALAFNEYNFANLWIDKAREIWDELWPELIMDDGFFAEQSSYYHVLLTRTLIEYLVDADRFNRELSKEFLEQAKNMCTITNMLVRSDGTIPIFGDASPDMPILWLRGLPVVCKNIGYLSEATRDSYIGYAGGVNQNLYSKKNCVPMNSSNSASDDRWSYKLFKDSGFLFARNNKLDLELTAIASPSNKPHGHADSGIGSFEIWCKGKSIIVDGGIPQYGLSPEALLYKGAKGQNTILLNGIAPTLLKHEYDLFPIWYSKLGTSGAWEAASTGASFQWYGFSRLKKGITWCRSWSWHDCTITVTDKLIGARGSFDINMYLHFKEKKWFEQNDGTISGDNCELMLETNRNAQIDLIDLPHSPNYGEIQGSMGVWVHGNVKLPFELKWVFNFNE